MGGLLSSSIFLIISTLNLKSGKLMLIASIPMLIDVVLYSSGLYYYSINIAFITGLLFGSVGIAYIYHGLQILIVRNGKSE